MTRTFPHRRTMRAMTFALCVAGALLVGCGTGTESASPEATPLTLEGLRIGTPDDLVSYRYRVEVSANADLIDTTKAPPGLDLRDFMLDIEIEGERINPDRERTSSRTNLGYFEVARDTIVIGTENWSREGAGVWRENLPLATPEDFLGQDVALSPSVILHADSTEDLRRVASVLATKPFTMETVNGRETRHWVLDDNDLMRMFDPEDSTIPGMLQPTDVQVDVWGDVETGVAVRLVLVAASPTTARAFVVTIDLFDLNDPSIAIEEPEGVLAP